MSKDMEEQLKQGSQGDWRSGSSKQKNCVTLLRYSADKTENSYAQVQLLARKIEDEKFQQVAYVSYKLEEIIYLLDVKNSVYEKSIANKPICNVIKKVNATIYSWSFFFPFKSGWVGTIQVVETSFSS